MVRVPVASKRLWGEETGGDRATTATTKAFWSEIRGMAQEQNAQSTVGSEGELFSVPRRALF